MVALCNRALNLLLSIFGLDGFRVGALAVISRLCHTY
jgi:hypothetical protein